MIEQRLLRGLGVSQQNTEKYLDDLNSILPEHQIDSALRVAHFLAQVLHESAYMKFVRENLNYSADALRRVFPKYFTPTQARAYARKPKMIGNRVYANRMGNGDEFSGDGFRYRGRGLIQLTGKNNYRKFSRWIEDGGDLILSDPDVVASKYAVHSAVFYWSENHLNAIADIDDVRLLTKRINGGYHGLPERIKLLDKAKQLLGIEQAAIPLEAPGHRVKASSLNLRSSPRKSSSNLIATLNQGAELIKLGNTDAAGWVRIKTSLNGNPIEGYVANRYLERIPSTAPLPSVAATTPDSAALQLPQAHLKEGNRRITRQFDGGRAHPLGEAQQPRRNSTHNKAGKLIEIINYLNCENPAHKRWWSKGSSTFCNIYAYDYCYLANAYLPRVWWTDQALPQISAGQQLAALYGQTVTELNANTLYVWLEKHGGQFGWKRVFSLDVLQAAANNGEVCLIVARRRDGNLSGHITAVVPENNIHQAVRNSAGEIVRPLESQAGTKNHCFVTQNQAWWTAAKFESFSFWRHD